MNINNTNIRTVYLLILPIFLLASCSSYSYWGKHKFFPQNLAYTNKWKAEINVTLVSKQKKAIEKENKDLIIVIHDKSRNRLFYEKSILYAGEAEINIVWSDFHVVLISITEVNEAKEIFSKKLRYHQSTGKFEGDS